MSQNNSLRNISVVLTLIATCFVSFQNCSQSGFQEVDLAGDEVVRRFTSENLDSDAQELAQADASQAAEHGFDCQVFASENYVRCSRKSGMENQPGKSYSVGSSIQYAGRTLKLRFVYYGTSNNDQQAYADANCSQAVDYPMGSGVYQYTTNITVPTCKDDGTGQCPQKSGCQKLNGTYSGAKYYKNIAKKWTHTEILYDNSEELNAAKAESELPPGVTCETYGEFIRCSKQLSKVAGASYSVDASVNYKGQNLRVRTIYFGTSNNDQQAYADANCTQAVDYPMGSGTYPGSLSGNSPTCKSNGQCVTDTQCRALTQPQGQARYYRNKSRNWTTAEVTWDNSGADQVIAQ